MFSFNGNKTITTGGGGAIVSNDRELARAAKHLTNTARLSNGWNFEHDTVGYNYRMPNLNAALGCAQLEQLDGFLANKRALAERYAAAFKPLDGVTFFTEPKFARSNYWLNVILLDPALPGARDAVLDRDQRRRARNPARPGRLMHKLPMYRTIHATILRSRRRSPSAWSIFRAARPCDDRLNPAHHRSERLHRRSRRSRVAVDGGNVIGLVRPEARTDAIKDTLSDPPMPAHADEVRSAIEHFAPDAVLHAAGTAAVGASLTDPAADYSASVATAHAALEGIRRSRRRPRFLFPSSAAIYGEPAVLPVAETAPIQPLSPYGYHKAMAELLIQEYAQGFDVPALIFRLFSVFGAHQKRLLVHELFERFRRDAVVTVQGTGEEMRDFLHEDDLAAGLLGLLPGISDPIVTINLATGQGTRVKTVAATMRRLLKSSKEIRLCQRRAARKSIAMDRRYQRVAGMCARA